VFPDGIATLRMSESSVRYPGIRETPLWARWWNRWGQNQSESVNKREWSFKQQKYSTGKQNCFDGKRNRSTELNASG
jgi:hypothetical protein